MRTVNIYGITIKKMIKLDKNFKILKSISEYYSIFEFYNSKLSFNDNDIDEKSLNLSNQ